MKLLKLDDSGNINVVINASNIETIPDGFLAFDTDEDDLVLIRQRFVKNGVLKERVEKPSDNYIWKLDDEIWQLDLNLLRQSKSQLINQACQSTIVSGFISYALGDEYHYPSKTTDQQNLAASVLASYDPENEPTWSTPFWCADGSGKWEFRPHTASQIREVGRDAKAAILGFQFNNEQLQAQISMASTAEEIEAITWSN